MIFMGLLGNYLANSLQRNISSDQEITRKITYYYLRYIDLKMSKLAGEGGKIKVVGERMEDQLKTVTCCFGGLALG